LAAACEGGTVAFMAVSLDVDAIVDAYQSTGLKPYHLDFDEDGLSCSPLVVLYVESNLWLLKDGKIDPDERLTVAHDARRNVGLAYAEESLAGFLSGWERPDAERDVGDEDPFVAGAIAGAAAARQCRDIFGVQWW
jgi:hypothetical protein